MKNFLVAGALLLVGALGGVPVAHAFTVVVDGSAAEWTMAAPAANLAHIGRDAAGQGAWIWRDAAADERTDFAAPDPRVDLALAQITSDASNLYFMFRMTDIDVATGDGAPQVQIAIDVDRSSGSGQTAFAGFAD